MNKIFNIFILGALFRLSLLPLLADLPFSESFEDDPVGAFSSGTRGWNISGAGAIVVNSSNSPEGEQHLESLGSPNQIYRSFSNTLGEDNTWMSFYVEVQRQLGTVAQSLPSSPLASAFYFNNDLTLRVIDFTSLDGIHIGNEAPDYLGFDWTDIPDRFPGIKHAQLSLTEPRNLNINILRVDTRNPDIRFATTGRHPSWGQQMDPPFGSSFSENY